MRRAVAGAAVSSEEGCAAAPVLSSGEALQQARAKGLVLRLATRARRATSACVAIRGQDSQESGHTRRRCGAVART